MIEILHRYTKAVLYKSETATTVKDAVVEAVKANSDLRWSDLSGSDLRWSDLSGSNLSGSDLRGSDLSWSDLSGSNLSGSDLRGSDLSWSDLRWSDLRGSNGLPPVVAAQTLIAPEGDLIGWKKCCGEVIVKLLIPATAKRSNATGRKCRAEFVDVLEVIGSLEGVSNHDGKTRYIAGQRVTCDVWCEDRWQECAGGIHFFITREEAEEY